MKKTVKALSLVLALVLAFSCLGIQAFAANADNVKKYDSMVVLGDSISRGCGLNPAYADISDPTAITGIQGSYPYLLAEMCGVPVEGRCFCTYQAQTLSSVLALLGIEEGTDPLLTHPSFSACYQKMQDNFGDGDTYQLGGKNGKLANAELIVLELGESDIFFRSLVLSGLLDVFNGEGELTVAIPSLLEEMLSGCSYVISSYEKLLKYIRSYNRDADIVIVGLYNMLSGLTLSEDVALPIGDAEAIVSGSINVFLKELAKKYNCKYADITNVPTPAVEEGAPVIGGDVFDDYNRYFHPSIQNGLPYIARQILNVLPTQPEKPVIPERKTNIKIDLGFVKDVDYVLVDGKKICADECEMNGTVLTIPWLTTFAKTVTVAEKDDVSGKITLQLYQLSYNLKNGYTAYRLLSNSDVVGAATKVVKTSVDLISSVLGGLFKKQ